MHFYLGNSSLRVSFFLFPENVRRARFVCHVIRRDFDLHAMKLLINNNLQGQVATHQSICAGIPLVSPASQFLCIQRD